MCLTKKPIMLHLLHLAQVILLTLFMMTPTYLLLSRRGFTLAMYIQLQRNQVSCDVLIEKKKVSYDALFSFISSFLYFFALRFNST